MASNKVRYKPASYPDNVLKAYKGTIIPLSKFSGASVGILHRCTVCNTVWRSYPSLLLTPTGSRKAKFNCPNCVLPESP